MKKPSIALLFSTLLLGTSMYAQEPVAVDQKPAEQQDANIRMGLLAQPNIGFFGTQDKRLTNEGSHVGFNYGLMVDFPLNTNNNYIINTGVTLLNIGGKLSYPDAIKVPDSSLVKTQNESKYRLRYINIPVGIKLRTNPVNYVTYYGIIGFDFGFNIRSLRSTETVYTDPRDGTNVTKQLEDDDKIGDQIQLLRPAFKVSGGLEYNISGTTNLTAAIEWNNGLGNIFSNDRNLSSFDDSGNPILEDEGNPKKDYEPEAVANYIALTIGVYF